MEHKTGYIIIKKTAAGSSNLDLIKVAVDTKAETHKSVIKEALIGLREFLSSEENINMVCDNMYRHNGLTK
jgi:hypothetical protein